MTKAPVRIWLQHADDADPSIGRMWCEDKVWPDEPDDHEPTEFVRADIVEELRAALQKIAGGNTSGHPGIEERFEETCIREMQACRDVARAALSRLAEVSK